MLADQQIFESEEGFRLPVERTRSSPSQRVSELSSLESSQNCPGAKCKAYSWYHVNQYLTCWDDAMCVPKCTDAMQMPIGEYCGRIRLCLLQNNMMDYQYYPPVCWLDYYQFTIDDYQRYVPDPKQ